MKTAVMTDTNSGIQKEEAESLGIFCISMPVLIDGESYCENENLTPEEYLKALTSKREVSTSLPSPLELTDEWDRILSLGYDEIVYIPMSSGLSSSCGSALGFADEDEYEGKVFVVDNRRISVSQRTSVMDAKYMADKGMGGAEIREYLEKTAADCIIYLAVDTLEYFLKTGRASSAAAALVSNVLSIKPILKTTGDKFEPVTIGRNRKKCDEKMIDAAKLNLSTRFKDFGPDEITIGVATSCIHRKDADAWFKLVKDSFPEYNVFYVPLSCSITTHTGPDARGIGIMKTIKRN
ncbi:MAG: DegV family EDD domain-containing protein [Lachnospiraceae bacterium]|nr:DegV family EDD domain-containing protein [Lachnospiraceae bacterium]